MIKKGLLKIIKGGFLRTFLNQFIDHHCLLCSKKVENQSQLCPFCCQLIPPFNLLELQRPAEINQHLDGLYSGWDFSPPIPEILEKIKFSKQKKLLLNLCQKAQLPHIEFDFITYVPISFRRYKERGFNQAKIIAKALSFNPLLIKDVFSKSHTSKQSLKNKKQRYQMILSSPFKVKKKAEVKGLSFLLVDDILTTGSTFAACAKTLKEAGANKVYGFSLIHSELD